MQLGIGNMVIATPQQQQEATTPSNPGYIREHQLFHIRLLETALDVTEPEHT
ncbi:hypothetical protein D3C76_1553260 [compost metagenome]